MSEIQALAALLAPGSYAVILLLLIVVAGLLRRVVHIPDDKYVMRELYDAILKDRDDWKAAATAATATAKEQADQLSQLTDINERLVDRLGVSRGNR